MSENWYVSNFFPERFSKKEQFGGGKNIYNFKELVLTPKQFNEYEETVDDVSLKL